MHWVFICHERRHPANKSIFSSCQMPAAPKTDAPDGPVEGETRETHHQRPRAAEAPLRSRTTPWKQELQEQRLFYFLLWIEAENKEKKRRVEALQRRSSHRNQNQGSGPGILWERSFGKGRGGGSGSAKPVASERAKKATAFFFCLLWLGFCATMEMKLSRNRDGWVGWPMVGQVPVQAGLSTHGSVCAVTPLCCAVLQGICYSTGLDRARQGSTGGSEETDLAHSIEHTCGIQLRYC